MSQLPSHHPKIAECYKKCLVDPSLVSALPVDEWISINELPCLSALHFRLVLKGLFAKLVMPKVWGQAWVDFTTHSGKMVRSEEIMPMAILVTDGVGEGKLGMVTLFCHSDKARVEPLVALPTLIQ